MASSSEFVEISSTSPEAERDVVACIGTGIIGRSWAIMFARAGKTVRLYDESLESLSETVDFLAGYTGIDGTEPTAEIRGEVIPAESLDEAVGDAVYVQESVVEDLAVKRDIFAALDNAAPADAILASSTSAIPASDFTGGLAARDRCLVAHPASPPHLLPGVELVSSRWTATSARARAHAILRACGLSPVDVQRETTGFVMNRLQAALVNEAFALIAEGVIDPCDLDSLLTNSLGRRWAVVGPLRAMALNAPGGFADYAQRYAPTYEEIAKDLAPVQTWDPKLVHTISASLDLDGSEEARVGARAERDARLARVATALHPVPSD